MKKLFLSVSLLATSLMASAQFATGNGGSSFNSASTEGWSGVRFSYVPTTLEYDKDYGIDDVDFNGFSLEYFKGFGIMSDMPVFLEVGAGIEWLRYSDSESGGYDGIEFEITETDNIFSLNIPVNLGYKFSLSENVTVMPYVGLKANLGLSAKQKISVEASYDGETEEESEDYSWYDEDDMGDNTLKRFFLGWQVGATATYNQYTFSVNYGSYFTDEIYNKIDDCKLGWTTISVGYTF